MSEGEGEVCDILTIVREEDGTWTVGCCEMHDPLARVWDRDADARAELGPGLDWWEEEPGVWMADVEGGLDDEGVLVDDDDEDDTEGPYFEDRDLWSGGFDEDEDIEDGLWEDMLFED